MPSKLFVDWRNLVLISFLHIAPYCYVLSSLYAGTFQFPIEFLTSLVSVF